MLLKEILGADSEEVEAIRRECADKFSSMLTTLGMDREMHDGAYYRHSLQAMQSYYFLSMDLAGLEGGPPSVARIVGRHLKFNWNVDAWELALLLPGEEGMFVLFRYGLDGEGMKESAPAPSPDWAIRTRGFPLDFGGKRLGEVRLQQRTLRNLDRADVDLYARFLAQGYGQYLERRAMIEDRADTFQALPVGVAGLTAEGGLKDFNHRMAGLLALSGDDLGKDFANILSERLHISPGDKWETFVEDEDKTNYKNVVCVRDWKGLGGDFCLYISAHKRTTSTGAPILALIEDLADVSELEMEVLSERDFMERLLGSMRDLVMTTDPTGRVAFVSRKEFEFALDKSLFEIAKPLEGYAGSWTSDGLGRTAEPVEVQMTLPGGERRQFEFIVSRLERGREPRLLVVGRDLTLIRRLERRVRRQAAYDELTNLFNRYQFQAMLAKEISRTRRTKRSLGILFLDLDGLKAVNDTQGHQAGDAVLREVGDTLNREVRTGMDYPCRFGGDEFSVIVTEVAPEQLEALAGRLRLAVKERLSGVTTVSVGMAMLQGEESMESLLERADKAVYQVKAAGGDGIRWADSPS